MFDTIDFAAGYKTTAFAIVYILSAFGHSVSQDDVLAAVTAVGVAVGNIGMAYGLVMKLVRYVRNKN